MKVKLENSKTMRKQDGTWVEIEFNQLHAGDIFRLFGPNGVWDGQWKAIKNPECINDIWRIIATDL